MKFPFLLSCRGVEQQPCSSAGRLQPWAGAPPGSCRGSLPSPRTCVACVTEPVIPPAVSLYFFRAIYCYHLSCVSGKFLGITVALCETFDCLFLGPRQRRGDAVFPVFIFPLVSWLAGAGGGRAGVRAWVRGCTA